MSIYWTYDAAAFGSDCCFGRFQALMLCGRKSFLWKHSSWKKSKAFGADLNLHVPSFLHCTEVPFNLLVGICCVWNEVLGVKEWCAKWDLFSLVCSRVVWLTERNNPCNLVQCDCASQLRSCGSMGLPFDTFQIQSNPLIYTTFIKNK